MLYINIYIYTNKNILFEERKKRKTIKINKKREKSRSGRTKIPSNYFTEKCYL